MLPLRPDSRYFAVLIRYEFVREPDEDLAWGITDWAARVDGAPADGFVHRPRPGLQPHLGAWRGRATDGRREGWVVAELPAGAVSLDLAYWPTEVDGRRAAHPQFWVRVAGS